jgi:hypothetical protein
MTTINEYNNSFIYKIISTAPDFEESMTYYGSTKRTLNIRMDKHRSKYKNNYLECSSKKIFDMYGMNNCFIQLVQKCNCNDKYELALIEAFYIKNHPCCNDNIPTGIKADNMKDWDKEYKRIHKEEIKEYQKEYMKEYRESHTEEMKEYDRIKYLKKKDDPDFKTQRNERNRLYRLKKSQDPVWVDIEKERRRIKYLNNKSKIKERDRIKYLKKKAEKEKEKENKN